MTTSAKASDKETEEKRPQGSHVHVGEARPARAKASTAASLGDGHIVAASNSEV